MTNPASPLERLTGGVRVTNPPAPGARRSHLLASGDLVLDARRRAPACRFMISIAALATLTACVGANRPPARVPSASVPAVSLPSGEQAAIRTFVLQETWSGGAGIQTAVQPDPRALVIAKDIPSVLGHGLFVSTLMVFPLVAASPECVEHVQLRLHTLAVEGPSQATVAVYPSAALSLAAGHVPAATSGGPSALLDNRPRGLATVTPTSSSTVLIDITDLYRTWASGGPFPSQGRSVPPGTPLVVSVGPPMRDAGAFTTRVSGLVGPQSERPSLTWTAHPGCGPPAS